MKKLFIMLFVIVILPLNLFAITTQAEDIVFELVSVESLYASSVRLHWRYDCDLYELGDYSFKIYRASSENGRYIEIDWSADYDADYDGVNYDAIDTDVEYGKTYYYKLGLFIYNYDTYEDELAQFTDIKSTAVCPEKMGFKAGFYKKNTVMIEWEEPWDAVDGYVIYRSNSKDGAYTKIKTITKPKTTSYVDTTVKEDQIYYYKMRAYLKVGDKVVYGEMSEPVENKIHVIRCQVYFTKTGDLPPFQDDFEKYIEVRYGDRVLTKDKDYSFYINSYLYSVTYSTLENVKLTLSTEGEEFIGSVDHVMFPVDSEPLLEKATVQNYGIKISWEECSGCGYTIYRKVGSDKYSKVKTITDCDTTSWTDTSATKSYTTYSYYIKAYTKKGSETLYSNKSNIVSIQRISTPKLKSVTNKKEGLVVKWDAVKGAKWYSVYRKNSSGKWESVAHTIDTEYVDKSTTIGKKYTYTVCCTKYRSKDKISYYKSEGIEGTRKLVADSKSESSSSVTVSWNKMSKADGYILYRATSENGTYKKIATIKTNSTLSYTDKKLSFGKYYYYKVKPYTVENDKKVFTDYQATVKVRPTTKTVKVTKAKATTPKKIKVTWDKVSKVDGYQIYQSATQFGTYKKVKTIKGNSTTSYTVSGLKNDNRYYFKVRAYKKVKDKTYYGDFSVPKNHCIDMLASSYEDYTDKANRIWGTDYKKYYNSAKDAKKDMKTIKIKTWDINKKGKKYTRYHYLTVHKNIAYTVEAIFDEIYKGKEKFPIKSVGGYSWRGDDSISEHCLGLAIDINPNENAQFNINGKPSVGSFWKPGKNPYSIPENGDVVKAFEKYGFGWGDGFLDFMHFSYFGW